MSAFTWLKYRPLYLGVAIAALYWLVESTLHSLVFGGGGVLENTLPHDPNELWMRSLMVAAILAFAAYVHIASEKLRAEHRQHIELEEQLNDALTKALSGFVTICAGCKRVPRTGADQSQSESWEQIEAYISRSSEVQFSHSICPRCEEKLSGS